MTIYYCLDTVLRPLETAADPLGVLVDVTEKRQVCGGHPEDGFMLSGSGAPNILDLGQDSGLSQLCALLESVPLYHINMELALDKALIEKEHDNAVRRALEAAFSPEPLPRMPDRGGKDDTQEPDGSLRHPALGHMKTEKLAALYITFLKSLNQPHRVYEFTDNILAPNRTRFTDNFDGFMLAGVGKVRASVLVADGTRIDHNPEKPLESCLEDGKSEAVEMDIDDSKELVWAWLEADHYQMRRCRDIHRVKSLSVLPRTPAWVRHDIMSLITREAMKQEFARQLREKDPDFSLLKEAPAILGALGANADGDVDPLLQRLLSQTLNDSVPYAGAADTFAGNAAQRLEQARSAGFR